LFEVVDRRAKLVANELSEEPSDSQTQVSNVQGSSAEKTKPRAKAQKRLSTKRSPKPSDTINKQTSSEVLKSDVIPDKDKATFSSDNERSSSANSMVQTSSELYNNSEKDNPTIPSSELLDTDLVKHSVDQEEVSVSVSNAEASLSTSNGELLNENASDVHVEHPPPSFATKDIEVVSEDHLTDGGQNSDSQTSDVPSKTDQEGPQHPQKESSQHVIADSHVNFEAKLKEDDVKVETPVNQKKPQEQNADTPQTVVQDQLDEAQGLLKTTNSTGQSKEARLARVCAGLSSRLQEYKSENAQLEELLIAERELSKSYEARIKQLQQDLSVSKSEVTRVESNMLDALAAKNSEIEALVNSMDALKKQAALSEGNLASLQANMESIMRNRELTETRMMQALREELASAERRAEEERAAHNATKMVQSWDIVAAMEREVELEHRAVESSTALARIQRVADERATKAAELEQKVALLEVECTSLNQELQDMEARFRRGQKKSPEEANQMLQAWQEEVERARQGQRDAESKLSSLEASII
ncbi:hypothetical protein Godav_012743, partial [Gossypium davidsonii]|nr:hypothetical protein [Gossypium davidsonii]